MIGIGDFDGDGRAELVWHNTITGTVSCWTMAGSYLTFGTETGGWQVISAGDFDGDGRAELLWHNTNSGQICSWTFAGAYLDFGLENGGWQVID